MDLVRFISNIKELEPLEILLESAELSSEALADTNRENLSKGVLASGDSTEEYASLPYTNMKSNMGSISVPNMDFKLSGKLHKGIYSKVQGSNIIGGSTDSKADRLQSNWGDDLFTVQETQFEKIVSKHYGSVIDKKLKK
jgi:hypothetical protein